MKKNSAILASVLMIVLVTGCGSDDKAEKKTSTTTEAATESVSEEPVGGTQLANPWRDITEEEAAITCPRLFAAPEGAQNVKWSVMESGETTTPMVQLVFTQNSVDYTARAQVGTEEADISGNYYQWTETDDITLANWGNGNQKAKLVMIWAALIYVLLLSRYIKIETSQPALSNLSIPRSRSEWVFF